MLYNRGMSKTDAADELTLPDAWARIFNETERERDTLHVENLALLAAVAELLDVVRLDPAALAYGLKRRKAIENATALLEK